MQNKYEAHISSILFHLCAYTTLYALLAHLKCKLQSWATIGISPVHFICAPTQLPLCATCTFQCKLQS